MSQQRYSTMSRLSLPNLSDLSYPAASSYGLATPHPSQSSAHHVKSERKYSSPSSSQQQHFYSSPSQRTPGQHQRTSSPAPSTIKQQRQRAHNICQSCGSNALRENALGFYSCQVCGAQSADHIALTNEVEEEMYGNMKNIMRGGTRIKSNKPKARKLTEEEIELVRSRILLYGFNCLLQAQCRTLVLNFGAPSLLVGVVGRLWLTYLSQWRDGAIFKAPNPTTGAMRWGETHLDMIVRKSQTGAHRTKHSKPNVSSVPNASMQSDTKPKRKQKRMRSETEEEEEQGERNDEEDDEEYTSVNKKRRLTKSEPLDTPVENIEEKEEKDAEEEQPQLSTSPPLPPVSSPSAGFIAPTSNTSRDILKLEVGELSLSLSISILYLSCHLLREPITMQQLCSWINLGRVPYFFVRLPTEIQQRVDKDSTLHTFFHPHSVPSATRLISSTKHVAECISAQMERQAQVMMNSNNQEQMTSAQVIYQQAFLMRQATATTQEIKAIEEANVTATAAVANDDAGPSPPVTPSAAPSPANTSLLLRTWLDQLHLPSELHPLILEIMTQLDLHSTNSLVVKNLMRKKRGERESAAKAIATATATQQHQLLLMSCLILAVQLTYGTTMGTASSSPATAVPLTSSAIPSSRVTPLASLPNKVSSSLKSDLVRQVQENVNKENVPRARMKISAPTPVATQQPDTLPAPDSAVPQLLSALEPSTPSRSRAASTSSPLPLSAGGSPSSSSTIAANWSSSNSSQQWPQSIHAARSLPADEQTTFIEWMGEVVMSRLNPPKDFDVYLEQIHAMAMTKASATSNAPTARSMLATRAPSLLSRLSCEEVVSYVSNRRGAYHPEYTALLEKCAALIGVVLPQLHASVHEVIQCARELHGGESVFVNTQEKEATTTTPSSQALDPPKQRNVIVIDDDDDDSSEVVPISPSPSISRTPSVASVAASVSSAKSSVVHRPPPAIRSGSSSQSSESTLH